MLTGEVVRICDIIWASARTAIGIELWASPWPANGGIENDIVLFDDVGSLTSWNTWPCCSWDTPYYTTFSWKLLAPDIRRTIRVGVKSCNICWNIRPRETPCKRRSGLVIACPCFDSQMLIPVLATRNAKTAPPTALKPAPYAWLSLSM